MLRQLLCLLVLVLLLPLPTQGQIVVTQSGVSIEKNNRGRGWGSYRHNHQVSFYRSWEVTPVAVIQPVYVQPVIQPVYYPVPYVVPVVVPQALTAPIQRVEKPLPPPAKPVPVAALPVAAPELPRWQRLLKAGDEAFAEGRLPLAELLYKSSSEAAPIEGRPHFHLAQLHFSQGQFAEAVNAIRAGLKLTPDWPGAVFKPRNIYQDRGADYGRHLARLTEAVNNNLNDPTILFLLGYQLWFDGKKDEAEVYFRRAAALLPDPAHVQRFLKGKV
jgi:hypothetical protein